MLAQFSILLTLTLIAACASAVPSARSTSITISPPTPALTTCGESQISWTGSVGQTAIVVLDADSSVPIFAFDQQPNGTTSVTWEPIFCPQDRKVKIVVTDQECRSSVSSAYAVGSASGVGVGVASTSSSINASSSPSPTSSAAWSLTNQDPNASPLTALRSCFNPTLSIALPEILSNCSATWSSSPSNGSSNNNNYGSVTKAGSLNVNVDGDTWSVTANKDGIKVDFQDGHKGDGTDGGSSSSTSSSISSSSTSNSTSGSGSASASTPDTNAAQRTIVIPTIFTLISHSVDSVYASDIASIGTFKMASFLRSSTSTNFLGLPPPSAPKSGYLPYWLLLVSIIAGINSLTNFFKPTASHKVYSSQRGQLQATALTGRLFATWNLLSAVVRIYAAYSIHERAAYEMALATFLIALGHFGSEIAVFKTASPSQPGTLSALLVASSTTLAMVMQYGYYVG